MPLYVPRGFPIQLLSGAAAGHTMVQSTTYFFSAAGTSNPGATTTNGNLTTVIPRGGRITKCWANFTVAGTLVPAGGTIDLRLRLNNAADITVNGTWDVAASASNQTSNLTLNQPVSAGDQVECKFITSAWGATNATTVFYRVMLWIEVP
jgi:hypothetical protein